MAGKIIALALGALVFSMGASAQNTPCSGKKGGVKSCTATGHFLCRDGSVSQSKKKCRRPQGGADQRGMTKSTSES
jgi:hypothetical protein